MSPNSQEVGGRIRLYACEACRKRKVRCTGDGPCDICRQQKIECVFNINRRRRGPRPRNRKETTFFEAEERSSEILDLTPWPTWRAALLKTVRCEDYTLVTGDTISVDLTLHLLVTFFTTINRQQPRLFSAERFFQRMLQHGCPRSLFHALCAAGCLYSTHRAVQMFGHQNLQTCLVQDSRHAFEVQARDIGLLGQAQALCALSICAQLQGDGLRAMDDLADVNNILQQIQSLGTLDDATTEEIALLEWHAHVAVYMLSHKDSLGRFRSVFSHHPNLIGLKIPQSSRSGAYGSTDILNVSYIVQSLSQKDFNQMSPAPWAVNSDFTSVANEISLQKVRLLEYIPLEEFQPSRGLILEGLANGDFTLPLMWHYSNLVLHRIFMPIPISRDMRPTPSHQGETKLNDNINFPFAPEFFLGERIQASIASARKICQICTIISQADFLLMSPFAGYCLFQAGLVLIPALYLDENLICKDDVLRSLKNVFTIVGNLNKFYPPSHSWLQTLFAAHRTGRLLESEIDSPTSLFSQFFNRFPGLSEPKLCSHIHSDLSNDVSDTDNGIPKSPESLEHQFESITGKRTQLASSAPSWISDYLTQLEGHIDQLETVATDNLDFEDAMQ